MSSAKGGCHFKIRRSRQASAFHLYERSDSRLTGCQMKITHAYHGDMAYAQTFRIFIVLLPVFVELFPLER